MESITREELIETAREIIKSRKDLEEYTENYLKNLKSCPLLISLYGSMKAAFGIHKKIVVVEDDGNGFPLIGVEDNDKA